MIHAYNEIYLNSVMKNLAALFDLAINAEGFDKNEFAKKFAQSDIASGIENGVPDMLAGKSATEFLIELIGKEKRLTPYFDIPIQHSEDSVLKNMNRRGDKQYLILYLKTFY